MARLDNSVGVSDMVMLESVSEDAVVDNLQRRFEKDQIYTYISNVLVSVNPYKRLPLYSEAAVQEYRGRNLYELSPHLYAIADDAYRSLRDRNLDQCVIISGESGAGKTEASKYLMQYVAAVSGKGRDIDRVKEQLLNSNPVLEAFGNAKTNRNDNSSRFGKYMDIEFDFKGDPIGGVITNYLLEKSRVAVQSLGERNFHIFYQLMEGADPELRSLLKLKSGIKHYRYLQTEADIGGLDDKQNFQTTRKAMEVIGFSKDEIVSALQLVAAILVMGNLEFESFSNGHGEDGCTVKETSHLSDACALLKCDPGVLKAALTKKSVETVEERVVIDLKVSEAMYARDALCKALYARMFSWLIERINDSIRVKSKDKRKCMGVLDIYGFEIFETNTFEQLIINFCNEKLQQLFIQLILREEQEEYQRERVQWEDVDYFDNSSIVNLIEKVPHGILTMLDEECLRPGDVSDTTFLYKLTSTCEFNSHYQSRQCRKSQSDKTLPYDSFRIEHYAGVVTYNVEGFVDKNNDSLYRDLTRAMYQCNFPLLQKIFPDGDGHPVHLGQKGKESMKRPPTTGVQLKSSLNVLMADLRSKNPNYIRCIKPNDEKKSGVFLDNLVRHQVQYLGLVENIRVRRAGYAFRQPYTKFIQRYKMINEKTWPVWSGSPKDGADIILSTIELPKDQYCHGQTKIFIRSPATVFHLEARRVGCLDRVATIIQKRYRGWHLYNEFRMMKTSQIKIAAHYKGFLCRRDFVDKRKAAITIEAFSRGWKIRRTYRRYFKSHAGPIVARAFHNALARRYLNSLKTQLPGESPLDDAWPEPALRYRTVSEQIQGLNHKVRCLKYRKKFSEEQRRLLKLKVIAFDLFNDKKVNYNKSVTEDFRGDYVDIKDNVKWKKISSTMEEPPVVYANQITKINRKNGKCVSVLLVITLKTLYVLHPQSISMKYKIPVSNIAHISLSPLHDNVVLINFNKDNGNLLSKKGDYFIQSEQIIELVSSLYYAVQSANQTSPEVTIASKFPGTFYNHTVEVCFKPGSSDIEQGQCKIIRRSKSFEILEA